ncbi:MAG: T9SS type A sorting domain-containing protein [Bacteroidota bacterium]
MKKRVLFFALCSSFFASAQIPNNGFESWTDMGSYMEPQAYLTSNSLTAGPGYPVTRSSDHYPANVGGYSIRIESNTSLLPDDGYGVVLQNRSGSMNNGPGPGFPVTGHPTSLTGYYKFIPLNGDTLSMMVQLYLNGNTVAYGEFTSTVAQSGWTSFSIPFNSYVQADSATIMLASYYAGGPPPQYMPHGNSVLYVDNLNFNTLITANVTELEQQELNLQPNPANTELTVSFPANAAISEVKLYDVLNREIAAQTASSSLPVTLDVSHYPDGTYFIRAISADKSYERKLFICH